MAVTVNKTSQAEADIARAVNYLLQRNPAAAEKFISRLEELMLRLEQFPQLYPKQRRSSKLEWREVRMAVLRRFSYVVLYTFEKNTLVIRRIIHGSQNQP